MSVEEQQSLTATNFYVTYHIARTTACVRRERLLKEKGYLSRKDHNSFINEIFTQQK